MEGLEGMSHYDFQSKIACAWLDKTYFDKKKTATIPRSKSQSSLTSRSENTVDTQRRSRISERSLHPLTGSLKHRLNNLLPHWATTSTNPQHYCQLHYWATGKRKYQNVIQCKECNVVLCTDGCNERYHTDWDLAEKKCVLAAEYEHRITSEER